MWVNRANQERVSSKKIRKAINKNWPSLIRLAVHEQTLETLHTERKTEESTRKLRERERTDQLPWLTIVLIRPHQKFYAPEKESNAFSFVVSALSAVCSLLECVCSRVLWMWRALQRIHSKARQPTQKTMQIENMGIKRGRMTDEATIMDRLTHSSSGAAPIFLVHQ